MESNKKALLKQWYPTKNDELTPKDISQGSSRKVWWQCKKGQEWQTAVYVRTNQGSGCPYCAGRLVCPGQNDLVTKWPNIAIQWFPTPNGSLTAEMVTLGSHHKVWWQCPQGHVWKAVVYSRAGPQKCGCPVCAGRVKPKRLERYAAMMTGP